MRRGHRQAGQRANRPESVKIWSQPTFGPTGAWVRGSIELALMLERQILIVGREVSFGTLAAEGKLANMREMFLAGIGQRNGAGMAWRFGTLLCAKTDKTAQKQTGRRKSGQRDGGRSRRCLRAIMGVVPSELCLRVLSGHSPSWPVLRRHPIANLRCAARKSADVQRRCSSFTDTFSGLPSRCTVTSTTSPTLL